MPSKMRSFSVLLLTVFIPLGVIGQTNITATCTLSDFHWTFNSVSQSPCDVASSLLGICNGGSYTLQSLPDQTHYLGPSVDAANPCQCSTVSYSLISACAACQNRTFVQWSQWRVNCASVAIGGFPEPIPNGTRVPAWAYLDVKTEDNFDINQAKQDANATESTFVPQPTSTTAPTTTPTPSPTPTQEGSSNHGDVVGGSIAGGVFGLMAIIGLVGIWTYRRRERRLGSHDEEVASESKDKDNKSKDDVEEVSRLPTLQKSPPGL
ncbi:uncharacterized protein EV420DRAFT_292641 [Desarmillaria tabescens]|uniref:Uncharacterized protein n=1 Tax=Armillaria tabescens TaxID=1929756 RepID=A0AA39KIJ9_ARMTA|nr:uncharacterized protein EV420DRAFT_292641 [Desarmillaria tabescens]KAK0459823.1 hypothetical protein EV420DRAFT_292641 [Desarmillaria tabescens]